MVLSVSTEHERVDRGLEVRGTLKGSKVEGRTFKGLKSVSCCMLLHSIERKHKWQLANNLVL